MNVRFLEIAQIELDETIEYYNLELFGLGESFLTEILLTLDRIRKFPEAWPICSIRTHRCQTRRFPYGIIYQIIKNEILIIAIANLHRKPEYWKNRKNKQIRHNE